VTLELREISMRSAAVSGWDEFAMTARGSMESSLAWLRGWQLRHLGRARLFEIGVGGKRLGQCAILTNRDGHDLRDGVLLAPGAEALWSPAMAAILDRVGPGHYRVGSKWRLVPPATMALAALPGVAIARETPFVIQSVDFSRWPDWQGYWTQVSANVRRNVARAERQAKLQLALSKGKGALVHLPMVFRRSLATHDRKALDGSGWRVAAHVAGEIIACREHLVIASARIGRQPVSGKAGIAFGRHVHYLGGGSTGDIGGTGAGWLVMRALLQQTHARGPDAQFIMGPFDAARHDEDQGGGLLRSRRACRVSDLPAALTAFRYDGRG
jgi:hypothetical protein